MGRVRLWDEVHSGTLKGAPASSKDAAAAEDPARFGLFHGDYIVSNFHIVGADEPELHVFDHDKVRFARAQAVLSCLIPRAILPSCPPVLSCLARLV